MQSSTSYKFVSILVGILLLIMAAFSIYFFAFTLIESVIVVGVTLVMYIGLALFLSSGGNSIRVIRQPARIIERPVIKEVIVEKPVVKTIVRTVEKPVIKYIQKKAKKLNIEKFEYIGSSVNKIYHTKNCRLGKMIKKKYKEHSHQPSFFIKRKYKPCHVCILKDKKV